ncbi:MAG: hypothetical protein UZ11_BCD004001153 [Bacteroidetes bacterium OLB11]|nr:MAG: hypothetical protein UZ11_BCD004001153 [Bacteroidetes bacterium OLB11]
MIFRRSYTFNTNKDADKLKSALLGKHLSIHNIDFEIFDKDGAVKVIPHAENDETVHTLPITELKFSQQGKNTIIKMKSKPRRIDIGGIQLTLAFSFFLFLASIVIFLSLKNSYSNVSYILFGLSFVIFYCSLVSYGARIL